MAGPRVTHARQEHQAAAPGATMEEVRMVAEPGQARVVLVEAGEETREALLADAHACDALYGFEPVAPQRG